MKNNRINNFGHVAEVQNLCSVELDSKFIFQLQHEYRVGQGIPTVNVECNGLERYGFFGAIEKRLDGRLDTGENVFFADFLIIGH
jgi:hypothetical protein